MALASRQGSIKRFDMRNNVCVCQREKEKKKGKEMKDSHLMSPTIWDCLIRKPIPQFAEVTHAVAYSTIHDNYTYKDERRHGWSISFSQHN